MQNPYYHDEDIELQAFPIQEGARVLIVDDDPSMREMLADTLAAEGYDVHEASSGAALIHAVDRAASEEFDLIITDVRMPGIDGFTALNHLRARGCFVPAVVMTAFPDEPTLRRGRDLGCTVLAKPFALEDASRAALDALLRPAS